MTRPRKTSTLPWSWELGTPWARLSFSITLGWTQRSSSWTVRLGILCCLSSLSWASVSQLCLTGLFKTEILRGLRRLPEVLPTQLNNSNYQVVEEGKMRLPSISAARGTFFIFNFSLWDNYRFTGSFKYKTDSPLHPFPSITLQFHHKPQHSVKAGNQHWHTVPSRTHSDLYACTAIKIPSHFL